MQSDHTRRSFFLGAATAVSAGRVAAAGERIRVGVIGAGDRGAYWAGRLAKRDDVEVVAIADVYRKRAEEAAARCGGSTQALQDYRRITERKDVDAVVIAVCDHWHTPIVLDALARGKDAYLEKPMTFRMEEGPRIVKAVKKHNRVVQIGTQQKSGAHFIEAKERFIDSGALGKISLVRTWWIANRGYLRKPPAGFQYDAKELDWNTFLGKAPSRPFDAQRFFGWYSYKDYSTGQPGGLLVHTADPVHWYLGLTKPSGVVALGGIYEFAGDRDTPDTISILAEYPQKLVVTFDCTQSSPRGMIDVEFHGSKGVLNIFRYGYRFRPADKDAPAIEAKGADCDGPHMNNFLNAVRSRKQPNADVVFSHYLAAICHMGNLALETGRRVTWDPAWDVESL